VLNRIYKELGLDKCRSFYSGAAPITKDTLEFFIRIGIPLCEVYGMSESCGPHNIGVSYKNKIGSIGAINQFNRSKIIGKDEDGCGEIAINGRHIFMGYLNDQEKTTESFDEQGW
jgi:long-chain-fatty-acid--CoA ligase ACSBG